MILHHIDLTNFTAGDLKARIKEEVATKPAFKAYRSVELDTLKLYTKAQGTKTMNLIINMEAKDEDCVFNEDGKTLAEYGCGEYLLPEGVGGEKQRDRV